MPLANIPNRVYHPTAAQALAFRKAHRDMRWMIEALMPGMLERSKAILGYGPHDDLSAINTHSEHDYND